MFETDPPCLHPPTPQWLCPCRTVKSSKNNKLAEELPERILPLVDETWLKAVQREQDGDR